MTTIGPFVGEYRWLSNFAKLDEPIIVKGYPFWTTENFYQAMKCAKEDDFSFFSTYTPAEAKKQGRIVEIDEDWEYNKIDVMTIAQIEKFKQPRFRALLMNTGDAEIVEFNNWGDNFWGMTAPGVGQNHLGKIIMEVRRSLAGY